MTTSSYDRREYLKKMIGLQEKLRKRFAIIFLLFSHYNCKIIH